MDDREALARTFDASAGIYDQARPGYPEAMFDDLVRLSGIPDGGRILEIGCGTGKATVPLARRGYRILALEPGPNLAAVARRNLQPFPAAEVLNTSFEDWEPGPRAFDLVIAASSFDWLDPEVKYPKSKDILRPGGCAAVFANWQIETPDPEGFWSVSQDIYRRYGEQTVKDWRTLDDLPRKVQEGFMELGFEEVAVLHYPWTEAYDTGRYIKVLKTFSGHIAMPRESLAGLLADIADLIDGRFNGRVEKHWVTVLELARKAALPERRLSGDETR